jgi:hypothetical protein
MMLFVRALALPGWLLSLLAICAATPTPIPSAAAPSPAPLQPTIAPAPSAPGPIAPAVKQAQTTCVTCHVVPDSSLVTRKVWEEFVLPKMSFYTGVNQLDPNQNEEADLYLASGLFPATPMLSREAWQELAQHYLETAPVDRIPHGPRPTITVGLKQFTLDKPRFRREPPLTTLTTIDPADRLIYTSDATLQSLDILSPEGQLLGSFPVGNIPVWMKKTERGIYLACIGHFFPMEERRGQIILLENTPEGPRRKELFSRLPRPCHIDVTDLNQDGRPDLLVSMFGYLTGRLSWYEALKDDEYREHILFPKAGPLCTVVHDFNGDSHPDIAMLTGQETETLGIYYSNQKGGFEPLHTIFQRPPTYGHTYMEGADFNQDGRLDLLVCNGDNGDYDSPAKPYHGIRILLNRDGKHFDESVFLPMHGVFRAIARDFDEDGDLDIAAVSFYPDYELSPQESFIYWENTGDLNFKPYTFRECISGRWMTLDVGDLDGDGDLDLVLGSLIRMPSTAPDFVKDIWERVGPSVLVLKNTLRQPNP